MRYGRGMTVDLAIARIRAFAAFRGWSRARLASEAGMHDTTLRHFHEVDWNPRAETIRRLEAVIPDDFELGAALPERQAEPRPPLHRDRAA